MDSAIRYIGLALLIAFIMVTLWNAIGSIRMKDRDEQYSGKIFQGKLQDRRLTKSGVDLVHEWVENRTRPALNPFVILAEQFHYNAFTTGYDIAIDLENPEFTPEDQMYFVYQKGDLLFFRIETSGKNRVLRAEFSGEELIVELEKHLE